MHHCKSLLIGLAVLAGCGTGGLEQANFSGECERSAACGGNLNDGPLAVGGTLELRPRIELPGVGTPSTSIVAVDPTVIDVVGDRVTGVGSGMTALLVTDEAGLVLDFFHVFVELPDHLQVTRVDGELTGADLDGVIELLVGDELMLSPRPTLGTQLLVGVAPAQWGVDTSAVSILADGDPSRRRLVAREVGPAVITIESMGLSRTLTINVLL